MPNLATVADFYSRFDIRLLEQMTADNNIPISSATITTDTNINNALTDASGVVLSGLYTAYKYTANDLTELTAQSYGLLARITCDLAFIYMAQRRGWSYKDKLPLVQDSYELIQRLRNGERVLDFAENEAAGNTFVSYGSVVNNAQIGLVSANPAYFPLCGQNSFYPCCNG